MIVACSFGLFTCLWFACSFYLLLDLLKERSKSAYLIAKICLSTGTRWREAQNLEQSQIKKQRIFLTKTKNGKNRQLPITKELESEVLQALPFTDAYSTFKRVLKDSSIKNPKRASKPYFKAFIRQPFYDERRRYSHTKPNTWTRRPKNDNEICPPFA